MEHLRITVAPAGAWGSTLGKYLAEKGNDVTFLFRSPEKAKSFDHSREIPAKLPGIRFPDTIRSSSDPGEALERAQMVLLGPPSQAMRSYLQEIAEFIPPVAAVVSLTKGLEIGPRGDTALRMSQVINLTDIHFAHRLAVLSGPNIALPIAEGKPAATVIAARDNHLLSTVQRVLHSERFRVYRSHDTTGVELAGAFKNVISLAAGISDGLGMGSNAKAALITRGLDEMKRLAVKMGAQSETIYGLSGLGDLGLTANSVNPEARNHWAGRMLGSGQTVELINQMGRTVEGFATSIAAHNLAQRYDVEVPIISSVAAIVLDELTVEHAVENLLSRVSTHENHEYFSV